MITDILIILWFLFIVLAIGVIVWKLSHRVQLYNFTNKVDVPYITIDIQGHPFNMVVDTGCGVSIITANALSSIKYTDSTRKINLQAVTDETLPSDMVSVPITINGKELVEDFVVHYAEDFGGFQVSSGITIHGLLGNEFFEKTHCKIDYNKHTVSLS